MSSHSTLTDIPTPHRCNSTTAFRVVSPTSYQWCLHRSDNAIPIRITPFDQQPTVHVLAGPGGIRCEHNATTHPISPLSQPPPRICNLYYLHPDFCLQPFYAYETDALPFGFLCILQLLLSSLQLATPSSSQRCLNSIHPLDFSAAFRYYFPFCYAPAMQSLSSNHCHLLDFSTTFRTAPFSTPAKANSSSNLPAGFLNCLQNCSHCPLDFSAAFRTMPAHSSCIEQCQPPWTSEQPPRRPSHRGHAENPIQPFCDISWANSTRP